MDIFLKYELYMDECNKVAFNYDLFNKHPEVFENLFADEPLDIRVYQRMADKSFLDRNDNYSISVQWLVADIKDNKSILKQLFNGKFTDVNLTELERNILIFKEVFPLIVARQFAYKTLPGAWYWFIYFKNNGFKFYLPQEFIDEKLGGEYKTVDLKKLDPEDFLKYVVPDYYLALSFSRVSRPKDKESVLMSLGREWLNEENQVVTAIE